MLASCLKSPVFSKIVRIKYCNRWPSWFQEYQINLGDRGWGGSRGSIEPPKLEELTSKLVKRPVIPTFSLTLTVCCELLVLCQSLQPTTSEQTVCVRHAFLPGMRDACLRMSAGEANFEACQRIFTHHHDNGRTVRLGSDEHSLRKAR